MTNRGCGNLARQAANRYAKQKTDEPRMNTVYADRFRVKPAKPSRDAGRISHKGDGEWIGFDWGDSSVGAKSL